MEDRDRGAGTRTAPQLGEAARGCTVIPARERYEGKQELSYFSGVAAQLCMHVVVIAPGDRGRAHLHRDHETAVYVMSGRVRVWFGNDLEEHVDVGPRTFVYIPAGVPHLPVNLSREEPVTAVLARTDPNEQESVVLLPNLDAAGHVA